MEKRALILSGAADARALEERITRALAARLAEHPHYSAKEAGQIEQLNRSLFPEGCSIDYQTSEDFRRLAVFSQCDAKSPIIRSHRPLLGPVIVAVKKLFWKIVRGQLEPFFAGMSEFNAAVVEVQARQAVEIRRLQAVEAAQESSRAVTCKGSPSAGS